MNAVPGPADKQKGKRPRSYNGLAASESSSEDMSGRQESEVEGTFKSKPGNRIRSSQSALRIIEVDLVVAHGSTRAPLKSKPIDSHGLPLDASTLENDPNPLTSIQFCQEKLHRVSEPIDYAHHLVISRRNLLLVHVASSKLETRDKGYRILG